MREPVRKILIIEPSVIIAEGIRHVIDNFSGFDVCGMLQYVSEEPEKQLEEYDADIVIVDMAAFDRSGRSAGRDTIKNILDVPVVALLSSAMDAGIAAGYDATIYLSDRSDKIEQKLTSTLKSVPNEAKAEGEELSAREKEILVCVAKGMQNKEIADHFCISIYTVITHRKNITRKTGIKTVAGLTVYALLNNLIDMNSME